MAKVSCNFEGFFENILLQDTVIEQNLYLITRYTYLKRKVSYYKILLLISVSRYYLQDIKALAKCSRLFAIQRSTCMLSEMSRVFGHLVERSRELCFLSREVWSSAKLSSVVERAHVQLEFIKW